MATSESMEVEGTVATTLPVDHDETETPEPDDDEEDVTELTAALETALATPVVMDRIPLLLAIIENMDQVGPAATQLKERAVYAVVRCYCETGTASPSVTSFLVDHEAFLSTISKAKTAKLVRQILDIVCGGAAAAASSASSRKSSSGATATTPVAIVVPVAQQEEVARSILAWCVAQKRSFLRQRVSAKLAAVLYAQSKLAESLAIVDSLLSELKKLDDKQLLVETHLLESQLHFSLRNVPKSKAALTAARTAANAIYIAPAQQAALDSQSGTIHTEEADYKTAHSYFLEAFEQVDALNDRPASVQALKYMMLCKVLDGLQQVLAGKQATSASLDTNNESVVGSGMLTGKQAVKYAGKDLEAMQAIAVATSNRNLKELQHTLTLYPEQLQSDVLVQHHLNILQEQLLESNLLRIVEPYSCVQIDFVAAQIELLVAVTERKLSQMILDGILKGILDQGQGQLIVYDDDDNDAKLYGDSESGEGGSASLTAKGLKVVQNMDSVVTALFERSKALRTVMM
jgi:26S proteasome regulatory subunit N6